MSMSVSAPQAAPSVSPVAASRPAPVKTSNDGDADDGAAPSAPTGNVQQMPLAQSGPAGTLLNIAVK